MSVYSDLLIKQYHDQPNAKAEVDLVGGLYEQVASFINSIPVAYDIDNAQGNQQDVLGKILGLPRIVPFVLPKVRFGFEGVDAARAFGSVFNTQVDALSAPFASLFEQQYSDVQLDDGDYAIFLRARILTNVSSGFMVSDEFTSIQDVVQEIFGGEAYIVDNQNMTLTLFIDEAYDPDRLLLIQRLGLIPKPQGVDIIIESVIGL